MSNQSQPLFFEGENVLVHNSVEPLYNGNEYQILEVSWSEEWDWSEDPSQEPKVPCWLYEMVGIDDWLFEEWTLRKRYPPSSQSFSELMNTLKSPAKIS